MSSTAVRLTGDISRLEGFRSQRERANMGTVYVEVGHWLSERIDPRQSGCLLLEEEVEEGQTLTGFIERLTAKNSGRVERSIEDGLG